MMTIQEAKEQIEKSVRIYQFALLLPEWSS